MSRNYGRITRARRARREEALNLREKIFIKGDEMFSRKQRQELLLEARNIC